MDIHGERSLANHQIRPSSIDLVVNVHALVPAPLPNGPVLVLFKALAMRLFNFDVKTLIVGAFLVAERGDAERIIPASGGPIRIDQTSIVPDKRAGFGFIIQKFQQDQRQIGFFKQLRYCIKGQKLARCQLQTLFQKNDIQWRENDADASAAPGKTTDILVTSKLELTLQAQSNWFDAGLIVLMI